MRMPQVHCAENYLSKDTIDLLRKEIGLQKPKTNSEVDNVRTNSR